MTEHAEESYGYRRNFSTAWPQIKAVLVKNLLLLAYGMTIGFPTIVIPAVSDMTRGDLYLDDSQISWFSSINYICVPLGCFVSGFVTDYLGRRAVMRICTLPFIIAWMVFYFTNSVGLLYLGSILNGFTGGLLEAPVLTYVAEITQPYLRGMLSATSSMCVIIGIFVQFFFGIFFTWRITALVNICFPVIALIALFFVPESPHWLVANGKLDQAKESLQWLRGGKNEQVIEEEFFDLYRLIKGNPNHASNGGYPQNKMEFKEKIGVYTKRSFIVPMSLVSLVFFLGHFCGMTTLQTYAVYIFGKLNAPLDKYYATLILGIVQILGAAACVSLVHFTGKRILVFISSLGTAACCVIVGVYAHFLWSDDMDTLVGNATYYDSANLTDASTSASDATINANQYGWIPLTFLIGLALLSHLGIRLLPWILIGEVFTTETRSKASGLSSGFGYIFGFLANKMFLTMIATLTLAGTYWLYGAVILIGFFIFIFYLPETEGKTLAQIEDHFSGKKKLSNKVAKFQPSISRNNNSQSGKVGTNNPAFELNTISFKI